MFQYIRLGGVFLLLLLVPVMSFAQAEITGRIAGVVADPQRALVPGVTVTVEGPTLFAPRTAITAEDASYFIDKLPRDIQGFVRAAGIQNNCAKRRGRAREFHGHAERDTRSR